MAASHLYKVTHGKGRKQPKRRQKHCNFSHIGASSRFRKTSTGKPRLPFIQIPPALSQPACGFALSCPCVLQFQNMMHFFSLSTTLWKRFNAQCKRRKTKKKTEKKDRRYMVFGSRSCSPRHIPSLRWIAVCSLTRALPCACCLVRGCHWSLVLPPPENLRF